MLNKDANHSAKSSADSHRGNENTSRYLAAKRYDNKKGPYNCRNGEAADHVPSLIAIAELIIVVSILTLLEQYLHALSHVDSEEHIRVADDSRENRQGNCLCDGIIPKVLFPKDLHLEIPLDDESPIQATERSDNEIEQDLKEVPATIVLDLEHDELTCSKGIHCLSIYQ